MKLWATACVTLLLLSGCASKKPAWGPPIPTVLVTFRSHLSIVRNCESLGAAPTVETAKAAGANLALVFAPPVRAVPGSGNPQSTVDDAMWVPVKEKPAGIAGVRAFKCPDAFVDNITAGIDRPGEVTR